MTCLTCPVQAGPNMMSCCNLYHDAVLYFFLIVSQAVPEAVHGAHWLHPSHKGLHGALPCGASSDVTVGRCGFWVACMHARDTRAAAQ